MNLDTIWELAKLLGPGGTVLGFLLWWDERRERRQIQQHVARLHRDNTKRLERILRKVSDLSLASGARAMSTAKSGRSRRRGGE